MKSKLRVFLIPFMAIIELCLLGLGWMIAILLPSQAERYMEWCLKVLPSQEWYHGN